MYGLSTSLIDKHYIPRFIKKNNIDNITSATRLKDLICDILDEKNASNIKSFNLKDNYIAKYIIISNYFSQTESQTAAKYIEMCIKKYSSYIVYRNKNQITSWFTVDVEDIIVHIFANENVRKYYDIESLLFNHKIA